MVSVASLKEEVFSYGLSHPSRMCDSIINSLPICPKSGGEPVMHFKILVPSAAAGAIIGKGGETIAQLQRDTAARVKMSKSNDFYPGTAERVCLVTGAMESIVSVLRFIQEKIREKPDPNAKPAIDFDNKMMAERDKQVKILVPNSTAGMVIGKAGSYIKHIKEESGAYVQISQKAKDQTLAERCITVIGEWESCRRACLMILQKVCDDPQSGSCLNVSYADVHGPVANFNPTGSPFAVTGGCGANGVASDYDSFMTSMSSVYGVNGGGAGCLNLQLLAPACMSAGRRLTVAVLDQLHGSLRAAGYPEQAVSEVAAAVDTLSMYGILTVAGASGGCASNTAAASPSLSPPTATYCQQQPPPPPPQGVMYQSTAGGVNGSLLGLAVSTGCDQMQTGMYTTPAPSAGATLNYNGAGSPAHHQCATSSALSPPIDVAAAAAAAGAGGEFGPPYGCAAASPSQQPHHHHLPVNNNSYGLGTVSTSPAAGVAVVAASPVRPSDDDAAAGGVSISTAAAVVAQSSPSAGSCCSSSSLSPSSSGGGDVVTDGGLAASTATVAAVTSTTTTSAAGEMNGADSFTSIDMEVGECIIGAVLGPSGRHLVEIQHLSGASIQISPKGEFRPGTRDRCVTVAGSPQAVSTAQYLIEQKISEEEAKRARHAAAAAATAAAAAVASQPQQRTASRVI